MDREPIEYSVDWERGDDEIKLLLKKNEMADPLNETAMEAAVVIDEGGHDNSGVSIQV